MAGFREMVDVCGLRDLGFEGRSWTFEKKVAGGTFCRVRLDRALATQEWCDCFAGAFVRNLTAASSDHGPILLSWRYVENRRRKPLGFKYELMWEEHKDFSPMVSDAWRAAGEARDLQSLQGKLASFAGDLKN
jgi:hypothetical protein